MSTRTFSNDQKTKLNQLFNEGISTMQEIETLQGGLSDTIKEVAEELEIKPSILKKAVRTAYKSNLGQTNQDHDDLNEILTTVGRTL